MQALALWQGDYWRAMPGCALPLLLFWLLLRVVA
jgi:hypothetical protein